MKRGMTFIGLHLSSSALVLAKEKALDVQQVDELPAPARAVPEPEESLPIPGADWRTMMPSVKAEFAGREAPDLTRQERNRLRMTIAKIEASEAKRAAREEARIARKSRRAQKRRKL